MPLRRGWPSAPRPRTGRPIPRSPARNSNIRFDAAGTKTYLDKAYDAVADWISSAGLARAGPPREVYLHGVAVAAAAPGDPVCRIAYPIRS